VSGTTADAPRGIPGRLPQGERLLWQGAPQWQALAVRAMHVRKVAAYFALLLVWYVATKLSAGVPVGELALAALRLAGLALIPLGLLCLYAWLTARTTTYTITSRRVVMRFGIALPMTLNLPYGKVDSAAVKPGAGGIGDISLAAVASGERLAYPLLWPHARPWRLTRAEPTLRAVPEAAKVGQIMARALAAAAAVPVPPAPETDSAAARRGTGGRARAAA
jgi:hypothetical protein